MYIFRSMHEKYENYDIYYGDYYDYNNCEEST